MNERRTLPRSRRTVALIFLLLFCAEAAADWPRFRGPNGSGVADGEGELPVRLGPSENAVFAVEVPPGISSPVVSGGQVYLTALRGKELVTLALAESTGKVLWEKRAPSERLEDVHPTSSPAASTPAADGARVVVFFGSFGLLAYDPEGKELWRLPLGPFNNPFGTASSPIIEGPLVLFNCDQDLGSFLIAVDKATGKVRYRVERPEFPRGYSTPIVRDEAGKKQIIVAGTLRVKAYGFEDGRELWAAGGLARIVNPTPVLGDGLLFVAAFSPGGDAGERITMPSFDAYAAAQDSNKDGLLTEAEIPAGEMKNRFLQLDVNKDGSITRAEWENMARIFDEAKNGIIAFKPKGEGRASAAWRYERGTPYVPSPLFYRGHLAMVKDGGIFTVLSATDGTLVKQLRLPAGGNYYASPVAGGGKIYVASLAGEATVVAAGGGWEVLASSELGGACAATPAISGGRLFVRAGNKLFAFAAAR